MSHPLRTSVADLIEGLKAFENQIISTDLVRRFMDSTRVSAEELKPYTFFHPDHHTRNLIFRDRFFEVMAIAWSPGQKTLVHTHNGQLGWMSIPQGHLSVHWYKYVGCNAPENQNVVGIDCLAGATRIELDRIGTEECYTQGHIATVDKLRSIHQIENSDPSPAGSVSLHVYSLPFDSCVAFDLAQQRCVRKTLTYHSRFGKVEVETESPSGHVPILAGSSDLKQAP